MTQEEKAKAYDEALERARKQRDEYQKEFDKTDKDSRLASILIAAISAVEMAFPELAESEDERIRRELIEFIQWSVDRHFMREDFHQAKRPAVWIAYLEKQKYNRMQPVYDNQESFESALDKAWKSYNDCGSRTVDSFEDDYIECAHAKGFREGYLFGLEKQKECVSNNFDDVWDEEDCEEIIAEGQKLTPRFKELLKEVCHAWYDRGAKLEKQKSGLSVVGVLQSKTPQGPIKLAEWKEEAKIREWILAKMQELAATGVPCSDEIKMADKAIDYLIKQKEQKPAEWSDTNELVFKDICNHLEVEGYSGWVVLLNALRNGEFQPKQEWNTHDKAIVNCIVCCLDGQFVSEAARKQSLEWFNKHRRDFLNSTSWKPAEWSEEDEKMLKCCLIAINHYEKTCNIGDHLPTKFNIDGYLASVDKVKSWLKSLRPTTKK